MENEPVRTLDIDEASHAEYGRKRSPETWVLTRRGKPVAAVVPVRDAMDAETFALSHHPAFIDLINRSWTKYQKHGGISSEKARRRLGLKLQSGKRRVRPGHR
jgi:antitoxin (DNA-binding transcriptional repressor) of toxin-antitoxin stability system